MRATCLCLASCTPCAWSVLPCVCRKHTLDMPRPVLAHSYQCATLRMHDTQCISSPDNVSPSPPLRPALPPLARPAPRFCTVQLQQLLFEGLSCCWYGCTGLELKLLTFNRQLRIFGIMQMNLEWEHAGSISAKLQISAIPLIADSASSRCGTRPTAMPPQAC